MILWTRRMQFWEPAETFHLKLRDFSSLFDVFWRVFFAMETWKPDMFGHFDQSSYRSFISACTAPKHLVFAKRNQSECARSNTKIHSWSDVFPWKKLEKWSSFV